MSELVKTSVQGGEAGAGIVPAAPAARDVEPGSGKSRRGRIPWFVMRGGRDMRLIDVRGVALGLAVCLLLLVGAFLWKIAPHAGLLKKQEEFQFSVVEHEVEDFELKDPIRDILKEQIEELPDQSQMETPDIHITDTPTDVMVEQAIVQSKNIDIDTPKIDLTATQTEIQDAPAEILMTADKVMYAIQPIAADVQDAADIYKYQEPVPDDRPKLSMLSQAPKPGRPLTALPKAFGEQEVPSMGTLGPLNVNLFGTGDFFRTMERVGGIKARASVDRALHWLAAHQEPDGMWDTAKYEGDKAGSLGSSGLATLAFLSGGHTTRKGEYMRNVIKAVEAILKCQGADGHIKHATANLYSHAICTIALCEAYGRARDERIGAAAQRAVAYCEKAVNADSGWRYAPQSEASDMSVTAWFAQALKTARLAQVKSDSAFLSQAMTFLDSVTDKGGSKDSLGIVGYMFAQEQQYEKNDHPALTCAGMLIRQFSGVGVRNHMLVKGAEITKTNPPEWKQKDFYYWYYATYAMHNMGGEYRVWWNQRVRDVLLEHQCREGDNSGSWDPNSDKWSQRGGRVYCTALGALCLEVYYRYSEALTSFGVAPDLDELFLE